MIATRFLENPDVGAIQQLVNTNKGGGHAVIKWSKYLERIVKEKVRGKNLGTHSFARRYFNFASTSFYTFLDRYSKKTVGSNTPMADLAECFESFSTKFCQFFPGHEFHPTNHPMLLEFYAMAGPNTLNLLGFIQSRSDPDMMNKHFFEYMKALQEKNLPAEDIQVEFGIFSMYIDFFSKKQAKPDVRHLFEERLKCGQGVSAFKKHLNALLAPYSRCLAELLHVFLKPNVLFASNRPDSEIGAEAAEHLNAFVENHPNITPENAADDFSEYDSSQYVLSPLINCVFMLAMGAPHLLVDMYMTMRTDWVLSNDMFKMYGHEKMHSGEPFTLVGNSLFCMFVIANTMDFDLLAYALFKGDDSGLCGHNVRFNNAAMQWTTSRGLILKAEFPKFMEFTGMLVTRFGFFPDVIRKTVKFLSNVFRDSSHYKEAVMNLDADLACLTSQEHILYGAQALSEYYAEQGKTNNVSAEHIIMLLSFLSNQTTVQYDELPDVDLEMFSVYSDEPEVLSI